MGTINPGLSGVIFCQGSRAPPIWISKDPNQIMESSIIKHMKSPLAPRVTSHGPDEIFMGLGPKLWILFDIVNAFYSEYNP